MKHYFDPDAPQGQQVRAFPEDGSQDAFIEERLVPISDAEADELRKPPAPTQAQIEAAFTAEIQKRLDDFARTRNYDSILSACTYATSTVPKFKADGQACVNLRDATWAAAYEILGAVQLGQRPMPASIEDIEEDLPALEWPV